MINNMSNNKQKLELTWIGKNNPEYDIANIEPRILEERTDLSYGDNNTENMIIHGDNLLSLKALLPEYEGKVNCVFIDPPYNTRSAFLHYDDSVEHSTWLSLMKSRLELLRMLLDDGGSIWIAIDDNEAHYLKVLCDEIFGRDCLAASVVWRSTDNSNNDAKQFSIDHNYILVYGRTPGWQPQKIDADSKRSHFKNPDNDPRGPWFDGNPLNSPKPRPNLMFDLIAPGGRIIKSPKNGWRWSEETLQEKINTGEIRFNKDGTGIHRRTYLVDMKGLPPSTLWADLDETGHNRQAKYELKTLFPNIKVAELFSTPKPEKLLKQILDIATKPGDMILDSFLGSGTTAAVAHKLSRRYIGIEMGEHAYTYVQPRMKKVVDGNDELKLSETLDWKGGGGFKFYELAQSFITKDEFGNPVIDGFYNDSKIIKAMCKLMNFTYMPSQTEYWKHGIGQGKNYLYVTTQLLTSGMVQQIAQYLNSGESLIVCPKKFEPGAEKIDDRITIKKIPQSVLKACHFGKKEYLLPIKESAMEEVDIEAEDNE
jgi:adenine-specific DNA-methyltransferase